MVHWPVRAFLVLVAVPFVLSCHNASNSSHTLGDITPDSEIKEGSAFQIACTLSTSEAVINGKRESFDSSNIIIEFGQKRIEDHRIRRTNETTAVIDFSSASSSDSGFYYCYVVTSAGNASMVCSMHLEVGLAPRKIGQENFKCVSHHFENFTCNWNPPDYNTKTEYMLGSYLYSDGIHHQISQCPIRYSNTSCGWTTHSDPPYRQFVATHNLILFTSNKWGNMSETFMVKNNEVIVAPEVEDLHISEVASKSVLLQWKVPSKLDFGSPSPRISVYPRLVYEVHVIRGTSEKADMELPSASYLSSFHARSSPVNNGQYFTIRTNETRINVTNLIPYQTYKFKVRCIVEAVLAKKKDPTAFWSKLVQVTTSTRPDVPPAPPRFHMVYESIRTDQARRSVVLYWHPLNWTDAYGPGFHYIISYVPTFTHPGHQGHYQDQDQDRHPQAGSLVVRPKQGSSSSLRTLIDPVVEMKVDQLTRSLYTIDLLSSSTAYLFKIYSANQVNRSLDFSHIVIEKETLLPPRPVSVEAFYYVHLKYEIRWSPPIELNSGLNIVSYVISWCFSSKPVFEKCTEPLKSIEVPANVTAFTLKVSQEGNHHFAVTAKYSNGQYSPLSWASCIVPIGLKKLEKVPRVYAKAINSTAINVTWKVTCLALSSVITKFELSHCKWSSTNSSCIGSKAIISIKNSTAREYIINNLDPSTVYRFQLTAWTENTAGDESDLFFESTSSPPVSIWFFLLVSLLILSTLAITLCILKCLYSRYKFIFFVWKTQIELPNEIQVRTFDCDANSPSNMSSLRYSKKYSKNCTEGGDHLSARTISTTIAGGTSDDTFQTSFSSNFMASNSFSNGSHYDRLAGERQVRDQVQESCLSNIADITTIDGHIVRRQNGQANVLPSLRVEPGSPLVSTGDANGDIFCSSTPLLYSSPFDDPKSENRIYSIINSRNSESAVPGTESIPLMIRNSYEPQTTTSIGTNNAKVFFDAQPSSSSSICSATSSHLRTLIKQDSFDLESGYATTPCLSKESSIESGKSKSNIAATSLAKKGYVPFIPHYLNSTAS